MKKYVMALDQGTTSSRCILFDKKGNICSVAQKEFEQIYPKPGWVEHDPMEIWASQLSVATEAISKIGASADEIASIGITNQRETTVVWNRETGMPIYNAIVWQCRRTAERIDQLKEDGLTDYVKETTGLIPDAYFSASKVAWILDHVEGARKQAENGDLAFGTIDTWLVWKLTGGKKHTISYSNASVTGSLNLQEGKWYTEFLDYLGIPIAIYPELAEDSGDYGETLPELFGSAIPITSCIADQHAALFAQGCRENGMAKLTNGTGSFLDLNIGENSVVMDGADTVVAWKINGKICYAIEGYAAVTGSAVQWVRDGLKFIKSSSEIEELADSVLDTNGVYFVPALAGLGAPYWDPFARGMIIGLTRGVTNAHIARAVLQSIVFSIKDIIDAIYDYTKTKVKDIRIDGGASNNNLLAQMFADYLDCRIVRPSSVEATSLGAAELAGLYSGFWKEEDLERAMVYDAEFSSQMEKELREKSYSNYKDAVKRCSGWMADK